MLASAAHLRGCLLPQRARRRRAVRDDGRAAPGAAPAGPRCGGAEHGGRRALRTLTASPRCALRRRRALRVHRRAGAGERLRPVAAGRPGPQVAVAPGHQHPSRRRRIGARGAAERGGPGGPRPGPLPSAAAKRGTRGLAARRHRPGTYPAAGPGLRRRVAEQVVRRPRGGNPRDTDDPGLDSAAARRPRLRDHGGPERPGALAEAMAALSDDRARRDRMARNAARVAREAFATDRIADRLLDTLTDAYRARKRAAPG